MITSGICTTKSYLVGPGPGVYLQNHNVTHEREALTLRVGSHHAVSASYSDPVDGGLDAMYQRAGRSPSVTLHPALGYVYVARCQLSSQLLAIPAMLLLDPTTAADTPVRPKNALAGMSSSSTSTSTTAASCASILTGAANFIQALENTAPSSQSPLRATTPSRATGTTHLRSEVASSTAKPRAVPSSTESAS